MKGDFTRNTFDARDHFIRVLMQQGRVQLDADWNEQVAILLHYLQRLAADLIGPYGGPDDGFRIEPRRDSSGNPIARDFSIISGHYYVDGILCENENTTAYTDQPEYPLPEGAGLQNDKTYLVYLDIWERLITWIQEPRIREIALGGPDTAARAKVVCQVKILEVARGTTCSTLNWDALVNLLQPRNRGQIKAKGKEPTKKDFDPCIISPEARYRGPENQLYLVEIHHGGSAATTTFKWSRDNGSVIFPIRQLEGNAVTLEHLGPDEHRSLEAKQWVEIMDDNLAKRGEAGPFLQIAEIDLVEKIVRLANPEGMPLPVYNADDPRHPLLRRWDSELKKFREGTTDQHWIDLEDGIRIQFQPATAFPSHNYRTSDYWLIPARTVTGDVEWPMEPQTNKLVPVAQPPHGVDHHFAPLAVVSVDSAGAITIDDCRCKFLQLCELAGRVEGLSVRAEETVPATETKPKPRAKPKLGAQ